MEQILIRMDSGQANALIGANLRGLRGKRGYSREKLFELSGVPIITIRRIEGGTRAAPADVLIQLCNALGVNVGDFLDDVQAELKQITRANAGE
ncbi:helix-turn-helix domain-containing protein [Nocardia sp. NPDC059239]|uniref:helix-turn-helix domain-containing protein n=1 Tax=unclassified Nocardia TaxID=2637762 RepID=UPI0036CE118F